MNSRWISLGLSLLGIGGVGVTSWLSVKCHDKAKDIEDKKEKIFAYAPAIISGVGTSVCILGSHRVNRKEIAALTASCTYLAANRDKILGKVREKFGDQKFLEVRKESAEETIKATTDSKKGICYERTGRGNVKFVSWEQGRYFLSNPDDVKNAEKMINRMLAKGIIPTWNDYYDMLGIQNTKWGEEYIIPDDKWGRDWDLEKPVSFDYIEDADDGYGNHCCIIYTVSNLRREF